MDYAADFPFISTQELTEWAQVCHANVAIHAYDATYPKFMRHTVYFEKDHHCYPITDERLKIIATKANQGGVDNIWKHMSDLKWTRRH